MTSDALALLRANLIEAEGNRAELYDDATGKPLKRGDTLIGNLTGGIGYNFSARPLSPHVRMVLVDECIDDGLTDLRGAYPWFSRLDVVRQAAVLEMRFALGPAGFAGFKRMHAALDRGDYPSAAKELVTSKAASVWQPSRTMRLKRMVADGA